jgi:Flp pilus assembly protein TadG
MLRKLRILSRFLTGLTGTALAHEPCGKGKARLVMARLRTFVSQRSGGVAILFSLSLLPVLFLTGAAIDYSHASSVRGQLQKAVDSTALLLGRHSLAIQDSDLRRRGEGAFAETFRPAPSVKVANLEIVRHKGVVNVSAKAVVANPILKVFSLRQQEVSAEASIAWGIPDMDVALVLDNTGSMGRLNKMGELKKAAHLMLDILQNAAANGGRIRVSVVPFDTQVRLETADRFQPWLRPLKAGEPRIGAWVPLLPARGSNPDESARLAWEGYVTDRAWYWRDTPTGTPRPVESNIRDSRPESALPWTQYPMVGNEYGSERLARLQALSADLSRNGTIRRTIDEMRPRGCTNITLGTLWGLETLSGEAPFSETATNGAGVDRVMILLTDGWNTRDAYSDSCAVEGGNPVLDPRTGYHPLHD